MLWRVCSSEQCSMARTAAMHRQYDKRVTDCELNSCCYSFLAVCLSQVYPRKCLPTSQQMYMGIDQALVEMSACVSMADSKTVLPSTHKMGMYKRMLNLLMMQCDLACSCSAGHPVQPDNTNKLKHTLFCNFQANKQTAWTAKAGERRT